MLPVLESAKVLGVPIRKWVVLAAGLIVLVHVGLRIRMVPQYRTELGGVEHNVVYGIQKLLLGVPLYQDPEQVPFDVIQYGPAYFALCAAIGDALGIASDDARAVFLLSRIVALALTLLTCWIVYGIGRAGGAPVWAAAVAAGLTCCAYTEHFYSRADALQSCASFGALLVFLRWMHKSRPWLLTACAALTVLGFLAKQSGVLVMGLPALYLLLDRQWRALLTYTGSVIAVLSLAFSLLFLNTDPGVYWKNTVQGLANGFSPQMWQQLFDPPTYKYFIGWHLLAVLISVQGFRSRSPALRFLALAVPISVVFGLVTGLKYGSRLNYIHESLTLTFIGAAVLIGQLEQASLKTVLPWGFALYGGVFMAFRTNSELAWYRVGEPDAVHRGLYANDLAVHEVLVNELHLKPEDHVFITYREYLEHLLVGQSVMTQKDIVQYSRTRIFDYDRFHRAMRDGTVRFVVTDQADGPISYLDSTYTGWSPIRVVAGRTILARSDRQ